MWPMILAGAASGIAQSGLSILGQQQANKANKELAQQANQWNIEQWERQNAYNDPSAQMMRLKQAGLNPNLVYGSGNVSGNVTQSAPRAQVATVSNIADQLRLPNLLSELSMYQDIRQKEQNIDLTAEKVNGQRTQNEILNFMKRIREQDAYYSSQNAFSRSEQYKNQAAKLGFEVDKLSYEDEWRRKNSQKLLQAELTRRNQTNAYQRLELDLNSQLRPYGVSIKDPFYMRAAAMLWDEIVKKYKQ